MGLLPLFIHPAVDFCVFLLPYFSTNEISGAPYKCVINITKYSVRRSLWGRGSDFVSVVPPSSPLTQEALA
jgi:hypothetical protein